MPSSVLLESSAPRRGRRCAHARTPSRCFRGSPPACAAARFTHKAVASFGTATFASARLPYMYKDFSSVAPLMGARFASPAGEALRPPRTPSRFFKGSPPACAAARFTHKALSSLCFAGAFKVATNLSNVLPPQHQPTSGIKAESFLWDHHFC